MDLTQNMIETPNVTTPDWDRSVTTPACPASLMPPRPTFSDVSAFVERSYPIPTARILKSALRQIGRALVTVRARATGEYLDPNPRNLDLARLPFDLVAINTSLTGMSYRMAGFNTDKSFRNAMSGLRRICRDLAMIMPHRAPDLPPDHPFAPFLAAADAFELAAARRFTAKMIEDGRHPNEVTSDDLTRYAAFLSTKMVGVKIEPTLRQIARLWRRTADCDPGWPQIPLKPPVKTKLVNPAFAAYPLSLQSEIDTVRHRMEGSARRGPFDPLCDGRPLRPATVTLRLATIRAILGEHVAQGNDPGSLTSFNVLLSAPEAVQRILEGLWERGQVRRRAMADAGREPDGNGITGQLGAVGVTLTMLTRYFPPAPEALARIRWLVARVRRPPMSGMSRKNRKRIDQFQDPVKLALLLNLPDQLMTEALKLRERQPAEAARRARAAIFFAIELKVPLRMKNLHTCRQGYNLRFDSAGRKTGTLHFQAHEMKNHREVTYYVGPRLCALLRIYLEHFLPFFAATSPDQATEQWLFPAGDGKPGPLSASQVAKTINDIVAERVGAEFHPHLFRSLAAEITLRHDRGGHERLRQLLGDRSLQIVLSHYAPVRTREATEHQDRLVDREADRLATLATPVRRRRGARDRS